ncbi:unnamed protein product, partial [Staurois parvus]
MSCQSVPDPTYNIVLSSKLGEFLGCSEFSSPVQWK